jgi:hypothetical protein
MGCVAGFCVECLCRKGRQDSNLELASEDISLTTPPSALTGHTGMFY